jgi:hypothetical protein
MKRTAKNDLASLIKDLNDHKFAAVPRPDCLMLDTEVRPAAATAPEIIRHFGLDVA